MAVHLPCLRACSVVMVGAMTPTPVHSTTTDGSSFSLSASCTGSRRGRSTRSAPSPGAPRPDVLRRNPRRPSRAAGLGRAGRAASGAVRLLVLGAVPGRVADVVQRHAKDRTPMAYSESNFVTRALMSAVRRVADRQAGREGVGEADVVGASPVDEFLDLRELFGGVLVAPLRPQIRVVLGGVDVDVLLRTPVEVELGQPVPGATRVRRRSPRRHRAGRRRASPGRWRRARSWSRRPVDGGSARRSTCRWRPRRRGRPCPVRRRARIRRTAALPGDLAPSRASTLAVAGFSAGPPTKTVSAAVGTGWPAVTVRMVRAPAPRRTRSTSLRAAGSVSRPTTSTTRSGTRCAPCPARTSCGVGQT